MPRFTYLLLIGWLMTGALGYAQSLPGRANGRTGGLKGEYFNGPNFERKVHTQVDRQIDFNWYGQSPAPGVQAEYFSVRWTGKLYAPVGGKYKFTATVDDGVRIWVGGKKVIDEWRKQDDTRFVGEVELNAGRLYDLRVEYYNDWKGSVISVFWEPPTPEKKSLFSFSSPPERRTVIPAQYLFSEAPRPASVKKPAPARPAVPKPVNVKAVAGKPIKTKSLATVTPPIAFRAPTDRRPAPMQSTTPRSMIRPSVYVPKPTVGRPDTVSAPAERAISPQEPPPAPLMSLPDYVSFDQSDYVLLPESQVDLDKLVRAMQADREFRVELSGHTDNIGDPRRNQTLSEYRARVVANYLMQRGIAPNRLTVRGYGSNQPVTGNATEAERTQNRRVTITIRSVRAD